MNYKTVHLILTYVYLSRLREGALWVPGTPTTVHATVGILVKCVNPEIK